MPGHMEAPSPNARTPVQFSTWEFFLSKSFRILLKFILACSFWNSYNS